MINIFEFEDYVTIGYSWESSHIQEVNINEEIKSLVKQGYVIKNVSLSIIPDHQEKYHRWDKKVYLVIAEKENKDE